MDYKIVFYSAQKTSVCERALKKCLSANQLSHSGSVFATKSEALGAWLIEALRDSDIAFLIGGLDFDDSRSAVKIISNAAADSEPELIKRLRGIDGRDGYMLQSGDKLIVMLPDNPVQIEEIVKNGLSGYLKYFANKNNR